MPIHIETNQPPHGPVIHLKEGMPSAQERLAVVGNQPVSSENKTDLAYNLAEPLNIEQLIGFIKPGKYFVKHNVEIAGQKLHRGDKVKIQIVGESNSNNKFVRVVILKQNGTKISFPVTSKFDLIKLRFVITKKEILNRKEISRSGTILYAEKKTKALYNPDMAGTASELTVFVARPGEKLIVQPPIDFYGKHTNIIKGHIRVKNSKGKIGWVPIKHLTKHKPSSQIKQYEVTQGYKDWQEWQDPSKLAYSFLGLGTQFLPTDGQGPVGDTITESMRKHPKYTKNGPASKPTRMTRNT